MIHTKIQNLYLRIPICPNPLLFYYLWIDNDNLISTFIQEGTYTRTHTCVSMDYFVACTCSSIISVALAPQQQQHQQQQQQHSDELLLLL